MHPVVMEIVAAERVKDMRNEAIASERARLVRRTGRLRSALASTTARLGMPHAPARGAAARHAG